ncbi:MAG: AAA family ATPase, partial [Nitrospirota bacterium]|nr:AAA family ATPase [Nitrospirota bacterium]
MSDSSGFSAPKDSPRSSEPSFPRSSRSRGSTPLELIDQCLASLPEGDQRIPLLYQLRHRLVEQATSSQQQEADMKKMQSVIEKLTAPANRIGTLLGQPEEGVARIMVGGAEYYANVDPRVEGDSLKVGHQILVNEAYVVIRSLGYDRSGPIVKVREVLGDGRLRIDQEAGRPGILIQRADDLISMDLKVGDEVRLDPSHRMAIERLETPQAQSHLLAELPTVRWEHIGGQQEAIGAIRRSIEYPLLHEGLFARYQFQQPKGFLLYGPPGCGKTLIGQATAASLGQLLAQHRDLATLPTEDQTQRAPSRLPPIEGGIFLHVKGPEVLNMWVGESERIIRDLFLQARQHRQAGKLPFIFIDEAESILGTRRAVRSYNVSNTLVPMFCAELDGIESLSQVVVILASNRPDMIDPAVLRSGRIDRKIKVGRPGRKDAGEILRVYLTADLPYATKDTATGGTMDGNPVSQIAEGL